MERNQCQEPPNADPSNPMPQPEPPALASYFPETRVIELFARIKDAPQPTHGLAREPEPHPRTFKIEAIRCGSHPFRLNDHNYRSEDLVFFVMNPIGRLLQLGGKLDKSRKPARLKGGNHGADSR